MIDEKYLRRVPKLIFCTITKRAQKWRGAALADHDRVQNAYRYKCGMAAVWLWVRNGEIYVDIDKATPLDCIRAKYPQKAVGVKITEDRIAFGINITVPKSTKCEKCDFYSKCCIRNSRLQKVYLRNDKHYFDFEIMFEETENQET